MKICSYGRCFVRHGKTVKKTHTIMFYKFMKYSVVQRKELYFKGSFHHVTLCSGQETSSWTGTGSQRISCAAGARDWHELHDQECLHSTHNHW